MIFYVTLRMHETKFCFHFKFIYTNFILITNILSYPQFGAYVYLEIVPFQFSYLLCTEIMAIGHWKGLVTTFSDVAT